MGALVAGAADATFAQDDDRGTLWYIRGSFGVTDQDLSELESALKDEKQELIDAGVDLSTYARDFDQIWDYRVEVGALFWKGFSLGFLFDYQPREDDQTIGGITPGDQLRMSERIRIKYYGFYGNLSYWWPGTHSLFISGRVGWGYGRFQQNLNLWVPNVPQLNFEATGDYDGGNVVYGISGGYQYKWENGVLIYLEAGYEIRDLGTFTGTTTTSDEAQYPGRAGNYQVNGEDVNFDFSGPFLAVGFGFTGPY
jgi:hypothetical protein